MWSRETQKSLEEAHVQREVKHPSNLEKELDYRVRGLKKGSPWVAEGEDRYDAFHFHNPLIKPGNSAWEPPPISFTDEELLNIYTGCSYESVKGSVNNSIMTKIDAYLRAKKEGSGE